jgi:hypothetical protein
MKQRWVRSMRLFVALTPGVPESERPVIAVRAVSIAAVVLLVFGFGGEPSLRALGITLPAFPIAGGILLLLPAIDMVMVRHTGLRATAAGEEEESEGRASRSEREMLKGPWVMGNTYTICGPYLFTLAQWLEDDGVESSRIPKVIVHRSRVSERPATRMAIAEECLMDQNEVAAR